MGYVNLILGLVKLVQALVQWASDKQLLDAGAKAQLADSLLATSKVVADGKQIETFFDSLDSSTVSGILHRYYTRD